MNDTKPALYLLDAYGLIYRSYFAFISRPLRNAAGANISAAFGFFRSLISLLDEGAPTQDGKTQKPLRFAAVFDSAVPTFRHELYDQYKANRQKAPQDLHEQVPLVEEALRLLGIPRLSADRFEADDLIATLAERCRAEGRDCYIISSDKDLLQLVGNGVYILRPGKGGVPGTPGASKFDLLGPAEVKLEWGVEPAMILDVLALTGDASDNVPGVPGIGDKTATKLVARYGSLDEIYKNIAGIEGAVGRKLASGKESAYFSRTLVTLEHKVPTVTENMDMFAVDALDREQGAAYLFRAGLRAPAIALSPETVKTLEKAGSPDSASVPPADKASSPQETPKTSAEPKTDSGMEPSPPQSTRLKAQGDLFDSAPAQTGILTEFQQAPRPRAPESLRTYGTYRTVSDLAGLEALINNARKSKIMAFDFETDSLDAWHATPFGFSLALEPGTAFYVPVAPHGPEGCAFLEPSVARSALTPLFADPDMTIVAHNAKYDYAVSRAWGLPRWKCAIWDGMVAAWLVDPERASYSLDSLVTTWLGLNTTLYDSIVPKGSLFNIVPIEKATNYSAEDADFVLRMKVLLDPCLHENGAADLLKNVEMPLLPILAEMEGAGIRLESGILHEYGIELAGKLALIENDIYTLVGHEFNIASTKQLQEVLFTERKLKTGKKTKTGFSTDVGVLEELAREDPVPARILHFRSLAKLKSTYVDTLGTMVGPDGRLHTHFVQTGTATGRLSSRDPNLQNIPIREEEGRKIRTAFIAEEGKILVSADYSQIELVVLAHLSGDEVLLEAFRSGSDVHRRTAALIFGVSEDQISSDQRRIAKTINFGVMYGMSAFRLSNELGISRTNAQSFIDTYFRTYSGVRRFIDDLIAQTEKLGYATTILGRKRYIPTIASHNKTEKSAAERIAVNTPIQGSAADIVKLAMLRVDSALARSGLVARMLLQVHDELIVECSRSDGPAVKQLLKKEMESAIILRVALRASVEEGRSWGDLH